MTEKKKRSPRKIPASKVVENWILSVNTREDGSLYSKPSEVKAVVEHIKAVTKGSTPLKGFISSGILFIGDPSYMAGELSQPGSELLESRENPFLNWDKFTSSLKDEDQSLPFPGAIDDSTSHGRGVAVQTNRLSGRFEVEKQFDEKGRLSQIVVKFYE